MYDNIANLIWKTRSVKEISALVTLEKYVNGTIIQWDRIQQIKEEFILKELDSLNERIDKTKLFYDELHRIHLTLFLDIHFYFVCIDKIQNLLMRFCEYGDDKAFKGLWNKYKSSFKKFNDSRNILEHIEREIKKREDVSDLGHLGIDTYTIFNLEFDISDKGIQLIKNVYHDVCETISNRKEK